MSKRSSIVHVEWRSRNVSRLKEFYKKAFHWKFDESMPGYLLASAGKGEFGVGFAQIDAGSSLAPGVLAFLESDDLGASETQIREAGGQIVGTPQDVSGWGRFTLFTDPDGNPMGLWQSADQVKKEEKRHKKAEKKRREASAQASQPSESEADEASKKAAKQKQKAEKRAHKAAAKAEKRAKKSADKDAKKADDADELKVDAKTSKDEKKKSREQADKKAKKSAKADRPSEDADR